MRKDQSRRMIGFVLGGCMVSAAPPLFAQTPEPKSAKEIIQKRKVETPQPAHRAPDRRVSPAQRSRVIVPRRPVRRHIRLELPTDDQQQVDFGALLTRSTRSLGFSLDYFDDSRKRLLEASVAALRANRRAEGVQHWIRFVASLETFDKPVDLEPVMYYVLREGCLRQDVNVLFHAERLDRLRVDLENIEEYWSDLYRLYQHCQAPGGDCLEPVERRIGEELEVLGQERDLAQARYQVARRALDRAQLTASGEVARAADYFYSVAQELARQTEYILYAD